MKSIYNVLIIDDHPLIAEAYKTALKHVTQKDESIYFEIDTALTIDEALDKFNKMAGKNKELIAFLDIKLPVSKDAKILSGEDLGLKLKEILPNAKIIVSTTYNDNYRIYNILKTLNPDGFLIKNDITPKELVDSIIQVIYDPPAYSKTVIKLLRKQMYNDFILDKIDRQILYQLSQGAKTKDLPTLLPLSITGIERRKRLLKDVFDVTGQDDLTLIKAAKAKGFI